MDSKILKALGIDPALIFLFLLVLIVILFVLYVNVTMKYNRLKSSYTTFMRGKDGKTLEESMMSGFSDVEAILKYTKQNRTDIQKLNKKMEKSYQKVGIVKYINAVILEWSYWQLPFRQRKELQTIPLSLIYQPDIMHGSRLWLIRAETQAIQEQLV